MPISCLKVPGGGLVVVGGGGGGVELKFTVQLRPKLNNGNSLFLPYILNLNRLD